MRLIQNKFFNIFSNILKFSLLLSFLFFKFKNNFSINTALARKVCAYKEYIYYVKYKDTIWKIAKKFKVSVNAIKRWNKLKSYHLRPGQKLYIYKKICWESFNPYKKDNKIDLNLLVKLSEKGKLKPTYKKEKICKEKTYIHIVKKGESLWSIARKYGVSISEIKRANNLKTNILRTGQKLIIKKKICKVVVKKPKIVSTSTVKKRKFIVLYKVQKGDNLWKIAKKFKVSISTIKKINNLKTNYLKVGQILKIPTYKVNKLGELVINRPLNFIWPVDGCIDTTPKKEGFNNSIIFCAPLNTPVKAVEVGKVLFAGPNNKFAKGLGNIVILQHPKGFVSVYAMLSNVTVKKGNIVEKGDIIGYSGASPLFNTTGVFFYILKKKGKKYYSLDPLKVLK